VFGFLRFVIGPDPQILTIEICTNPDPNSDSSVAFVVTYKHKTRFFS
jgi:hypothetical protein